MFTFRTMPWLRLFVSILLLGSVFTAYHMAGVQGEARIPPFVLIRLEDVGPGGQYGSIEQLGKLRAVLEYLQEQHVAYHIALIPRWIDYPKDGPAYDVRLDQADHPYVAAFQKVVKDALSSGAIVGMHGYTHQVGQSRRDDGHHESGIGNEFDVADVAETQTKAFAEERMREGLAIFRNAGITPQFWEAPHYHTTAAQDEVFRSYFGLQYQSEVQAHRNAPAAIYMNGRNEGSTLGAAYVPTPFDYIPSNKDERVILDRLGKSDNIGSFFYHPFLEFKSLIPVTDEEGDQLYRDGLPVYRYPDKNVSVLQKLVAGLKAKGYAFYSIQDYVPFTPAQHVTAADGSLSRLLLGDADGDGQVDRIDWNERNGDVSVTLGRYQGVRNEQPGQAAKWGRMAYKKGAAAAVSGRDEKGPCSVWKADPNGKLERYAASGGRFEPSGSWTIDARAWDSLYTLPLAGGDLLVAGLTQERRELYGWLLHKDEMRPLKPYKLRSELRSELQARRESGGTLFAAKDGASAGIEFKPDTQKLEWTAARAGLDLPNEEGKLRFGDYNGDGLEDVFRWNSRTMTGTVYLRTNEAGWKLLSGFGPWGVPGAEPKLWIADADGNGKSDLALQDGKSGDLDVALSFIRQ
ncbi:DUF2334 domain-containing protein [Paenibacillus validus]|uniref:DUF2334 domain-containing protein n=1 Tax=Paenibacillus TaxID=44249 RepID=UPI000FD842AC|nr:MULTISPECIES: DUF2334 domain-containing protein [Paenibacillus]MED4601419.1 DUF2334 domain-containing protein [Paenibacillus validus]MED4606559.1 DUF2334 domain-containing protein [Paenibacillus validus]